MDKKIKRLINTSKEVISDCALENGAIVAANTDKPYYPRTASNWRLVWPRDASYICVAADILKLPIQEPFFDWLTKRPEDFKKECILYQSYSTNGRCEEKQFQPDQAGAVLWAIWHHFQKDLKKALKFEELIRRIADGLCQDWKGKFFFHNTVDIWEESHRMTSTAVENNHTYSLAACVRGLKLAYKIIPRKNWDIVANQMRTRIMLAYDTKRGYFLRNFGKISDYNVDASLLGLVYPFQIVKVDDVRTKNTIRKIGETLVEDGGIHRYQFDYYDGDGTACEGSGTWPLLNFWMSILWSIQGNRKKALEYYDWVIERVDKYIPEQIFKDDRVGVYPLTWSHAMFIIASKFLGYI